MMEASNSAKGMPRSLKVNSSNMSRAPECGFATKPDRLTHGSSMLGRSRHRFFAETPYAPGVQHRRRNYRLCLAAHFPRAPLHRKECAQAVSPVDQVRSSSPSSGRIKFVSGVPPIRSFYTAEIWRIEGDLRSWPPSSDPKVSEECYQRALDAAQACEAHSLELRAATSLARLWRNEGNARKFANCLFPSMVDLPRASNCQ